MKKSITIKTGSFFVCAVASDRMQEDGSTKRVKEQFCIEACSFGEAEKKAKENATGSDFSVDDVSRAPFNTIFLPETEFDDQRFYRVKAKAVILDDNAGKEKSVSAVYLVKASSTQEAGRIANDELKDATLDFELVSVIETKISDILD